MAQKQVKEIIYQWLRERGIPFDCYEHERANTIEDCLKLPFVQKNVMLCKNLLLCNRQKTDYYFMLLCPDSPFRTAEVSKALGVSRLSFAPAESLLNLMDTTAGSLSPLSLYFCSNQRIGFCYEKAIRGTEKIAFHPCDNSATVIFDQAIFWEQVLPLLYAEPIAIEIAK